MTAQTAAAARQQRGAFVVAFMVVAGTAISSDLLKKIKEFLPDNGRGHGRCERNGGCGCGVLLLCLGGRGGGVVCFTHGASVGGSVRTTYYQYVIETCRGHNY